LANYEFDQAEGLRRMLAGPKPRVFTFLSAASPEEKGLMLINLGASLVQAGQDVLLFDACTASRGVAARLDATRGATLQQVARQQRPLEEVVQVMPQGFGIAALTREAPRAGTQQVPHDLEMRRMTDAFVALAQRADIVLADAELGADDAFAVPNLANSEIVVQVANTPESIKAAYATIKRLNVQLGRRPFSIIVSGASDTEAQVVYRNLAQVANRYLAVKLNSLGSVPADVHLKRAMHLGRAVTDAFPRAGAAAAFRRLAGQFVMSDIRAAG
jgi:flagellar biosynthesis protein FlhG